MSGVSRLSGRSVVPLVTGALLGFAAGYFAAGGGRPSSPPPAPAGAEDRDRMAQLQRGLEKDPENPELLTALGNAHYDREEWELAIEVYEKARRKAPRDANLLSDLGAAYRNSGELRRAVEFFERARESDPEHWQSLLNLAVIHAFDIGDAAEAQRFVDELKRRFPEIPQLDQVQEKVSSLRAGV